MYFSHLTLWLTACVLVQASPAPIEARAVTKTKTVTVPVSPSFVPIRSSLPGLDCDSNCGANPITKRNLDEPPSAPLLPRAVTVTTTVYAACATNNVADLYHAAVDRATDYISGIAGANDQNNTVVDADSAYDCCVYAFTRNFAVAMWQFAQGSCATYNVAGGGQPLNRYAVHTGKDFQYQSIFGNGPNGEVVKNKKSILG